MYPDYCKFSTPLKFTGENKEQKVSLLSLHRRTIVFTQACCKRRFLWLCSAISVLSLESTSVPQQLQSGLLVCIFLQNPFPGACIICRNVSMTKGRFTSPPWSPPLSNARTWDNGQADGVGYNRRLFSWSNSCTVPSPSVRKSIYWILPQFFELKTI